jgi:diguanylate cyclase (GGDEF)-like protein/PAS domain S-box-containing protein
MNTQEPKNIDSARHTELFFSKSPALIFFIVTLIIFASEAIVMVLLYFFPSESLLGGALTDALLLVILISPALYFFLFRPMTAHIRERKKVEETLHQNKEQQFKIMVRASLDGFLITDAQGHFLEVNEAYCSMLGYSQDELLHMEIHDVEAVETPEETALHLAKLRETGNDCFETRQRCKDGRILNLEISAHYSDIYGGRLYSFLRDITERKRTEEALKLQAHILNSISDTVFLLDLDGNFVYLNEAAWKSRGYTQDEMMGMNLRALNSPENNHLIVPRTKELLKTGQGYFESAHRCKDGSIMPVEINARFTESGGRKLLLSVIRDATERKRGEKALRESESRMKELFEHLSSGVVVYQVSEDGQNFIITAFNGTAERIENMSRKDLIGMNVIEAFPGITAFGLLDVFRRVWQSGVAEHFPISFYQDGHISGWRDNYVYKLPNGEIVAIYDDVTKEKQAEERMHHLAHYDALTGLSNRTLFADRLRQAISTAKRDKGHAALIFIDLDKFKPVNDELGHDIGDLLLKEVAHRLHNCVRESDTVSRIGGDEFVVLLPNVDAAEDAMPVAEKILYSLNLPFELVGNNISISASLGVAIYPEHGSDEKMLTKNADSAMYNAKNNGRNNVCLYQPPPR